MMKLNDYLNKSKKLVKNKSMSTIKCAFLSNFTINGLAETIKVLCFDNGIYAENYTAPYNQYAQEILNKSSKLYKLKPDIIFIILDVEQIMGDFYYFPYRMDEKQRKMFIQERFDELKSFIGILKENMDAKIIFNNFLIPRYSSMGIIENKQAWGLNRSVQELNRMVEALSIDDSQLYVFDFNLFFLKLGYEKLVDKKMYYIADMRISPSALVNLSIEYMGYILPLVSLAKKCIVLDADNTLWGGIIGEDGMANIKLGPEKEGKPFLEFQKRLLGLFERGIILALNSNNNYDDVIEVMRNHKYMLLKEDNFACIKINWQDKAANMKEIAQELNIGLDSLVFIDDDKRNREMIRKFIPEVTVADLPEDPALYTTFIEDLNLFNTFSITEEDTKRGKNYIIEKKREQLKSTVKDIQSFINQLEIKVTISALEQLNIPRVSQLTQKTNQFNLTTKRYLEEDIKKILASNGHIIKYLQVEDKFGDYGITGAMIVKKLDELGYWEIDSFLLSCRILGKGIEFTLMQDIINEAKKEGIKEIRGKFIPTKKNKPAENFLAECGFSLDNEKAGEFLYSLKIGKGKKISIIGR